MFPAETTFTVTDEDISDVDPSRYTAIALICDRYTCSDPSLRERHIDALTRFAPYVDSIHMKMIYFETLGEIDLRLFSKLKHIYFDEYVYASEDFFQRAPDFIIEQLETVIIIGTSGVGDTVMHKCIPRMCNLRVLQLENVVYISEMVHTNSLPLLHTLTFKCEHRGQVLTLLKWVHTCMPALKALNVSDPTFEPRENTLKGMMAHGIIVRGPPEIDDETLYIVSYMRYAFRKIKINILGDLLPQVKDHLAVLDVILNHTKFMLPEALLYELIEFI